MANLPDPDSDTLDRAAPRLVQGGLVAFPTETVYGLGADAQNPAAVARIYAAKGRPSGHPVIVHLAPQADIAYWAARIPAEARLLIDAFWPGPLTLILPRAAHIPAAVSGGQDSIGLRCPSHPVAQALLQRFAALKGGQGGVAAPSANRFGQVSPTTAAHVRAEFPELGDDALLVLDGGAAQIGIESTIVDLSRIDQGTGPVLLRPGHITPAQLEAVLGTALRRTPDSHAPRASGTLKAHYAPHTPLQLLTPQALLQWLEQAQQAQASQPGQPQAPLQAHAALEPTQAQQPLPQPERIAVVAPHARPQVLPAHINWTQVSSDPAHYAQSLYALLRHLDSGGYARILMEQPPQTPAWQAVNDRLGRAAAAFESK